jgi:hypothetical protein
VSLDGAQDDAERHRLLRSGPDGEADPAAGPQHAVRFGEGLVRAPEVQETEAHHHGIEGGVGEGKRLGVARLELDGGVLPARLGQHRRGEVDPDHSGAPSRGGGGDVARPRRDVEHADAGAHARGIQQRADGLGREGAERVLVGLRDALPSGPFKGVERRGLPGRRGHGQMPGRGRISNDDWKSMSDRRLWSTEQ